MKTVCDVLGVAFCFAQSEKPDWQDGQRAKHTDDSVLATQFRTEPQSNRFRLALEYRHYVS